jgi:hypothetical protein
MSNTKGIVMAALIAGVVYLAANDHAGWGWLVFVLILLA